MDQSKDERQIQDLAQQLAAQFTAMRSTTRNSSSSSAPAHASSAQENATITQLATQLGRLLSQSESTGQDQQQDTDIVLLNRASFTDVPDPSIYEREFTDTYLNVNASVLRFEDRELLDLANDQMPIGRFFEEAEAMASDFPDDSIDDIVVS
ncbi:hypothetical protein BGX28_006485 [Mortierella sp. GBA30]|nr:hypothetical protein BGX28_006485 [Mortierella sp. GBA30]